MGNKTLLLVRHGDYTLTIEFPDNPDGSLNDKGQQQSAHLADHLQQTLKLDAIHTSPLLRASETAHIVAAKCPDVPLHTHDVLQECIPAVPPGLEKLFENIPADFIERGPGEAASAFAAFFTPLAEDEPDRAEVLITHGNLLGYLVVRALNAPADSWLQVEMDNCAITEIRIRPSGVIKLVRHNNTSHLPPELRGEHA